MHHNRILYSATEVTLWVVRSDDQYRKKYFKKGSGTVWLSGFPGSV